ncbi:MAG: BTAD domain-containing putative transcriptional regulator [Caldilineaceae bacterium]
MTRFTFNFFGTFQICAAQKPITDFHSDKARALLAYLALELQEHSRAELAALLWPAISDQYARTNLRNTLYRLRQTLDGAAPGAGDQLLTVTRQTVRFNADNAVVDVLRFQVLLDRMQHKAALTLDQLEEAIGLYQGELLLGFGVDDAPPFEEWLLLRRELFHQQAIFACHTLTTTYETAGHYAQAYRATDRLLTLDPYREESYRQRMRLLAYMGHPEQARQQLEQLRRLLRDEMGVDPAAETLSLAQAIASGEFDKRAREPEDKRTSSSSHLVTPSLLHPRTPSPALDLAEVPDPGLCFGRVQERAQIEQWLCVDRSRVVAIWGLGGMGKTTLAAQCVREIAMGEPDGQLAAIYWRSLVNAPPLTDLLSPLLQSLSDHQLTALPTHVDEQLRLLLTYLRERRVLLVLDNLESILMPEQAGAYRPGYEDYGQLIHQLATLAHQSHLLLTSRERPRGYARLEKDGLPVKSLQLAGLDAEGGRQLLTQRGMLGEDDSATLLIQRYSGNPLALKLVADTIGETFGGNIVEFLHEEVLVFDDIRTVLDQHFARLTDWERQILFWLAVEREPTPLPLLRNNLLNAPPQRLLVETMRNLQRRSLIEHQEGGFALQNVVTEYLTDRLVEIACTELKTGRLQWLHELALLQAQAKAYVRESQARLLLQPIGEQVIEKLGRRGAQQVIQRTLTALQAHTPRVIGYAAGNLLNLLLYHNCDLTRWDLSQLYIRGANLQGVSLAHVNFAHAEFVETVFTNHFGRVGAIAISPDCQWLAVGANDGNIRLWRLADGQLVDTLTGHPSTVVALAFSPDGRLLVSSSGSHGALYLWDVASGERVCTLNGHQGGVGVVAFSPDGSLIASGGHDGAIRLWDARTGKALAVLEKHTDWVRALAFHPSGELLVSGGLDQTACYLWQRQDPPPAAGQTEGQAEGWNYHFLGALAGHKTPIRSAAFSPNGALLATGSEDATVILWDVVQQTAVATLHTQRDEVHFVAFTPDSTTLAVSDSLTNISLWDVANRRLVNVLRRHERALRDMAISSDGRMLASGGNDGLVHLWDIHDPPRAQVIRTLHGSVQPIYTLRVSPNGDTFATGEEEGCVRLWQFTADSGAMQPLKLLLGHTALVDDLAFSPDGCWLASGAHDGSVWLWDVASGEGITRFPTLPDCGSHSTFSADGAMFAYVSHDTVHLMTIDASGRFHPYRVLQGHARSIRALSFSPDGRYLASCSIDNTVRLWEVTTGACLHIFDQDVINFWSLVFSPDGTLLAGGGRTGIHIWDLRTDTRSRIAYSSMAAATNIRPVAFSANGQYLVSGGIDRTVRIWDLEHDRQLHCLTGHTADVTSVAFLPTVGVQGDALLMSGSYDGTARLWNIRTGECRQMVRIPGPYAGMNITGVTGVSAAQRAALQALGAVEM